MPNRQHIWNACLAVAVLLGACSSGRATSDASTTGDASGGGGGTGGIGTGGGAGSTAGNTGTGGGGGTGGGVVTDAGTTPCGDAAACTASEVCVLIASGAASYVCPDAGHVTFPANCDGRVTDKNGCCYGAGGGTFSCAARPSGCGATVTCACARSTLCTNAGSCEERAANEIGCWQVGP